MEKDLVKQKEEERIGKYKQQELDKEEAEKQKKIMGGKYEQEAAEKKAIKTDTKVGERREALEKSKVNIEKRRIGKQEGKIEKFTTKKEKFTKALEKYKDNPRMTKHVQREIDRLDTKIGKKEKKITKIEDREEKGGIFKRMNTKIAENKADEAQRMLDPTYRQQKEARRNAKAADIFSAMVSPEAKRAGSYQEDLAVKEMESARLKQQKEEKDKEGKIHLSEKEKLAGNIYSHTGYDVGGGGDTKEA